MKTSAEHTIMAPKNARDYDKDKGKNRMVCYDIIMNPYFTDSPLSYWNYFYNNHVQNSMFFNNLVILSSSVHLKELQVKKKMNSIPVISYKNVTQYLLN